MEERKLYTKDFILLVSTLFIVTAGFMQLMPILPLFATRVVHMDELEVGLIVGSFSISAILTRPLVGYLLDNYTKTRILWIALIIFAAGILPYTVIVTPSLLILARIVQGFSWAIVTTSTATIAMDLIPPHRKGEGIAQYSLAMPTAMVIAPAMGVELLFRTGSFNIIFIISFLFAALGVVMAYNVHNPYEIIVKRPLSLSPVKLYEMRVFGAAFMQFCYSFAYSGIITFMPLYVDKNIGGKSTYFFMTFALVVVTSRLFTRKSFDRRGPTPSITVGFLSCMVGAYILSHTANSLGLTLSGAFYGLGGGLIIPAINTMSMNLVEPFNRGRANATIFTAIDVGMGGGALVMGYTLKYISYTSMFTVCGLIPLIPLALYFLVVRKKYYDNIIM